MSTVPQWLIGRYVTSIAIVPGTVSQTTGLFTAGSSMPLTGLLDEIELDQYNDVENIVPMDVRQDNEIIIGSGSRMTLREILSSFTSASFNVLSQVMVGYDYCQVTFTRAGVSFSGIFVCKGYVEGLVRGKSMGSLTIGPSGIAATGI